MSVCRRSADAARSCSAPSRSTRAFDRPSATSPSRPTRTKRRDRNERDEQLRSAGSWAHVRPHGRAGSRRRAQAGAFRLLLLGDARSDRHYSLHTQARPRGCLRRFDMPRATAPVPSSLPGHRVGVASASLVTLPALGRACWRRVFDAEDGRVGVRCDERREDCRPQHTRGLGRVFPLRRTRIRPAYPAHIRRVVSQSRSSPRRMPP